MVDFDKLKPLKTRARPIDPLEIFRRLPKPTGINDLYKSQAEVLESWFTRRTDRDVVVKLHTGGGKTLVGLLMAESTRSELKEPVLYLAPTRQLVNQTLEKARDLGIDAVAYSTGAPLDDDFLNGKAIMVATYKALFNGKSKFRLRGEQGPVKVGAVILDDAHVAFSVVRESFELKLQSDKDKDKESYESLTTLFRKAFREMDRLGTFDDVTSGIGREVLEVPYWAWQEQIDTVRTQLRGDVAKEHALVWPLLRDNLHLCHALISNTAFTITPILPLVHSFPTFAEATRRIYMSATIADDSEIVRTFDADPSLAANALTSRALAGISERMVLIPDLMQFKFKGKEHLEKLLEYTVKKGFGAVVLVPSNTAAAHWKDVATLAETSAEVERLVEKLQSEESRGPMVFASRYDGIDLPGDSCRLLVMEGLPAGTSDYELLRAATLYGAATINRMLAQRIEQGIGRGARGAGDHCVVILAGAQLAGWIARDANFQLLTAATQAQLDMGIAVSKEVSSLKDLGNTISKSFTRDRGWIRFHADSLAERMESATVVLQNLDLAAAERKAFNLWASGHPDKAIARLEKALSEGGRSIDKQTHGWLLQLAARMANNWGQADRCQDLQKDAFGRNPNLLRPKILPPYRPLEEPSPQAQAITQQLRGYRFRRGMLQRFEDVAAHLHANASANQFEQALADLAQLIGLTSERFDSGGEGPDVLWLLPGKVGLVIEAKSRKKGKNAFTKDEHGQLLVAGEWFEHNYPDYDAVRVSVHPKNTATKASSASESYALTYEKLDQLISDARTLLTQLCESQLTNAELKAECSRAVHQSHVRADRLVENYLVHFVEVAVA